MDPTIFVYTILTIVLSAVMVEETRDLRYLPLLATLGFTLVGGLLCLTDLGLTTEPSATITRSVLAVFAILAGFVFYRDLRAINKVRRGVNACQKGILECLDQSSYLLNSTNAVNEKSLKTEIEANNTFNSTTERVEGLQHG